MTTNLTLVTDEIAQYLASLDDCSLLVSLDGPEEIHNKFRVNMNGHGSFGDSLIGLEKLVTAFGNRAEACIAINTVVCPPYNKEKLDRIESFFSSLKWLPMNIVRRLSYVSPDSLKDEDLGGYKKN